MVGTYGVLSPGGDSPRPTSRTRRSRGGREAGEDLLQALHGVELSIGPMTLTWVRAGGSGSGTEMIQAPLGRRVTVSLVSLLA